MRGPRGSSGGDDGSSERRSARRPTGIFPVGRDVSGSGGMFTARQGRASPTATGFLNVSILGDLRGVVFFAVGFLGAVFGVAFFCFLPARLRLARLPQRRLLRANRTGHGITSSMAA
jgi:hypothetical protein